MLLKRVVADLQKWLNCSWTAGMIPSGSELVPELNVVCVSGDPGRREVPDLICPILGNSCSGLAAIVAAGPRSDGAPYSDDDRSFADAVCQHVAGLLGNDRLARNISDDLATAEQAREDEEIARGIFDRLDHGHMQPVPGLDYGGQCHRTGKACGDFFNFLPRGDDDLVLAIGSVEAHGLPGGIMLGGALASVRALVSRGDSLSQVAAEINRTLWDLSPSDSFTSFLCVQIDPPNRCLRYINAGHEPALLLRGKSDRVDRLESTGAVLGLSRRSGYREHTVLFEPGDLLAAFTEGVAESTGPSGVLRILREGMDCGVQDLAAHVLAAGETSADRTVVLVRSRDEEMLPLPMERFQLAAA